MMYEGCDDAQSSSYYVMRTPKKRQEVSELGEGGCPETKKPTPPSKDVVVSEIKAKVLLQAQNEHTSYPSEIASGISDDMYEALMVKLEADPKWKSCRGKMALIEGRIILIQIPDELHEIIAEQVVLQFGAFNNRIFTPLGSTRVRYGQANTCLESDKSFVNRHATHLLDPRGKVIPTIIVEVAYSESYESIQDTALQYLYNLNVRMVISIKILATRHHVNQLYCIVHTRDDNGPAIASQVISFGPGCRSQTVEAIIRHTGVHPDNFIGIGRPGFDLGQVNYPEVLNDEETFSIIVPNEVIWWNVPEARRFAIDQFRLRLINFAECLQELNYFW